MRHEEVEGQKEGEATAAVDAGAVEPSGLIVGALGVGAQGPERPFGAAWSAAPVGRELTRKRSRFIRWFKLRACFGSWRDHAESRRRASQDGRTGTRRVWFVNRTEVLTASWGSDATRRWPSWEPYVPARELEHATGVFEGYASEGGDPDAGVWHRAGRRRLQRYRTFVGGLVQRGESRRRLRDRGLRSSFRSSRAAFWRLEAGVEALQSRCRGWLARRELSGEGQPRSFAGVVKELAEDGDSGGGRAAFDPGNDAVPRKPTGRGAAETRVGHRSVARSAQVHDDVPPLQQGCGRVRTSRSGAAAKSSERGSSGATARGVSDAAGAGTWRWWPRGSSNGGVVFSSAPSEEAFRKPEKKWKEPRAPPARKGEAKPTAPKEEVEGAEWLEPMLPRDEPVPDFPMELWMECSRKRTPRSDPTAKSSEGVEAPCSAEGVQVSVEKEPPDRGRRLRAGAAAWRPASALAVLLAVGAAEDAAGRAAAVEALGSLETHAAWEEQVGGLDEAASEERGVDDVSPEERARREAVKEANLLPGAPRGLPACMQVKWRTLVADARLLLEAKELDDEEIVDEIAAFEETGGFRAFGLPLERTYDEQDCPNAPMDLDMLKTWWLEMGKELGEGWCDRHGDRESLDATFRFWRCNKAFFVEKMDEGKQKTKRRVDPLDGVEKDMPSWRLCEHMSFAPRGELSLNEATEMGYDLRKGTSGQLEDVDDAAEKTVRFLEEGHEVEYAKCDIAHAYRNFPIAAVDRCQFVLYGLDPSKPFPRLEDLDIDEDGHVQLRPEQCCFFVRNTLPFGWGRSVSTFWRTMRVVKRLHLWEGTPGLKTSVPRAEHESSSFLDDTLLIAKKGWGAASKQRLFELYERYGLPVEMAKDAAEGGVDTVKGYLGVLLDALRHELRMSDARMEQVLRRLEALGERSYVKREELESLVGVLSFAAKTSPSGRTFLRRMISALRRRGRFVRLNRGIKADIAWWKRYARELNGVSLFLEREWLDAEELRFYTDASLDGYGAAFLVDGKLEYFGGPWSDFGIDGNDGSWHISELEMLALLMAVDTWGSKLARRRVLVRVDNEATVTSVNKSRCADPGMMVCLRELFFVMARDSFALRCKWIGTKENVLADAASRAEWARFRAYAAAEFGVAAEDMVKVPVGLDTSGVLRRMEKSHRAAERR